MANICPEPLLDVGVGTDQSLLSSPCALPCTGTMFTAEEAEDYYRLQLIVVSISLLAAIIVNVTWGMFPIKAKQKMTFWVTFTSVAITFVSFLALVSSGSGENLWCLNATTPRRQSDGFSVCILQGMVLIFFGLALCCWWWCSCFDLFTKLYRRKRNIDHYLSYYHIFSWGLPFVCTFAILFSNEYGYEQPRLWCFLSPEAPVFYEYLFFYSWVGLLWITGTIMFILTLTAIFSKNKSSNNKKKTYWKKLSIYRIPLLFVIFFSGFWAIFAVFSLVSNIQEDRLTVSATSWVGCLLTDLGNNDFPNPAVNASAEALALLDPQPNENQIGCGFVQPGRLSPALLHAAILAISGNGLLLFFIFFFQQQNFDLWKQYFKNCTNPETNGTVRNQKLESTEYSSYLEIKRGIAKFTISCCEWFGSLEAEERKVYQSVSRPSKPNHTIRNPNFAEDNFPHVTYQRRQEEIEQNDSLDMDDPFPVGRNEGVLTRSETVGESILIPNEGLDQIQGRINVSTADWSDIYDDPLWGINVEF